MDTKKHNLKYRNYKTEWQRKWRQLNPLKAREQNKRYAKTYRLKHSDNIKVKARKIVFVELGAGRLKKQLCQVCGIEKVEAHHKDYLKPLEIEWLCKPHHKEADLKLRANLNLVDN